VLLSTPERESVVRADGVAVSRDLSLLLSEDASPSVSLDFMLSPCLVFNCFSTARHIANCMALSLPPSATTRQLAQVQFRNLQEPLCPFTGVKVP
jgi:hypothetical protein